jgi:FkbM family methyltransferase
MSIEDEIMQTPQGWWVLKRDIHFSRWVEQARRLDHDQPVLQKLAPYIKPGTTVIDVGAAIGDHTRFYLDRLAGTPGNVVAFEPHRVQFECLKRNCPEAINYCSAVGETEGTVCMHLEPDWVGSSRVISEQQGYRVHRTTIDLELGPSSRVSFMKVDVEGCEPEVLRGAAGMIRNSRPTIWMEVNPDALALQSHSQEELRDLIDSLGYQVAEFYPPGSDWNGCHGSQCDILCLPK